MSVHSTKKPFSSRVCWPARIRRSRARVLCSQTSCPGRRALGRNTHALVKVRGSCVCVRESGRHDATTRARNSLMFIHYREYSVCACAYKIRVRVAYSKQCPRPTFCACCCVCVCMCVDVDLHWRQIAGATAGRPGAGLKQTRLPCDAHTGVCKQ